MTATSPANARVVSLITLGARKAEVVEAKAELERLTIQANAFSDVCAAQFGMTHVEFDAEVAKYRADPARYTRELGK